MGGQLAERVDHACVVVGACAVGEGEVEPGVSAAARLRADEPTAPTRTPPR